jgi:peptidoglycan/LPS O-acetylase OafA/YrhL
VSRYRPDIDGLRALAIVPVILFHCDLPGWRSGFAGVDVFFVISGYLITGQILRDLEQGTFTFAGFYARRARRIVPALALVATATLVAGWIWFFPTNYRDLGRSVAMLAAFASNVFFWIKAGYFTAPAETKPLLHTWSISIEEQFYLVIPALVWTAWRWRHGGVVVALVGCLAASLATALGRSASDADAAFYLIQSRAWELAVGCLAATVPTDRLRRLPPATLELAAVFGLVLVLAGLALSSPGGGWPAPQALVPCLGTAALLVANDGGTTAVGRILALPLLVAIGLRSYSLYLWHWPFLAFARYASEEPVGPVAACAIAALSVPVACASFRFVEQPCRRAAIAALPRVVLPTAALLLAALAGAGAVVSATDGAPGRMGSPGGGFEADATVAESRAAMCGAVAVPAPAADMFCRLGTVANDRPKLLLVGDSFADMYLATFRTLSARFDREVWFLRDSRTRLDGRFFAALEAGGVGDVVVAYSWRRAMQAGIPELSRSRGSGLPSRRLGYDPLALVRDHRAEFRDGLAHVVDRFVAAGMRVYVVDTPPSYPVSVPLKLGLLVHRGRDPASFGMPLADHAAMLAPVHGFFDDLAARGLVELLRPTDILCRDGRCVAWRDGHSLYSDDAHLSAYGADLVAPIFERVFASPPSAGRSPSPR